MTPENRLARIAGLLYLLVAVSGGFSELYVRARARVPGDAAATADNIAASVTLFRVGALTDMVSVACFLLLALVLYRLLEPVGANAAVAMLVLNAVSVAAMTANLPNHLGALRAATRDQDTLAMLYLDRHADGYLAAGIFWLWLLPLGYLLYRSRATPRALGVLAMAGSFGYVADAVANLLVPTVSETLTTLLVLPSVAAEAALIVWLLARGMAPRRPPDQLPTPIEHTLVNQARRTR